MSFPVRVARRTGRTFSRIAQYGHHALALCAILAVAGGVADSASADLPVGEPAFESVTSDKGTSPSCNPGADTNPLHVFKVTLTCIFSGKVFSDQDLRLESRCIASVGFDTLTDLIPAGKVKLLKDDSKPIERSAKLVIVDLNKLHTTDIALIDGLDRLGMAVTLVTHDPKELVELFLSSDVALKASASGLKNHPQTLEALTKLQGQLKDLFSDLTGIDDVEKCKTAFSRSAPPNGTAYGTVVARLPLASGFTSLVVAPDGTAWVSVVGPDVYGIGSAPATGGFHLTPVNEARGLQNGFGSPATIGSDGDPYFGSPDHELFRGDLGGGVVSIGPFGHADTSSALAEGPDGTVWDAESHGHILHVRPDGTSFVTAIPVAPCQDSFYSSMVQGSDGAMWLADYGCARLLRFLPTGNVVVHGLGNDILPLDLAPKTGGGVWFTASAHGALGYADDDGRVARFGAPGGRPTETIAAAPDGDAWYTQDQRCGITALTMQGPGRHITAPFVPDKIAFAPDGSVWLATSTELIHTTLGDLSKMPGRCDNRPPQIRVSPSIVQPISVTELSQGLRISVNEPARVDAELFFFVNGNVASSLGDLSSYAVLTSPRQDAFLSISSGLIATIRREIRDGNRVSLRPFIFASDATGNSDFAPSASNVPIVR